MNDPFVIEQSVFWGRKLAARGAESLESRVDYIFRKALGRSPEMHERDRMLAFVARLAEHHVVDAVTLTLYGKDEPLISVTCRPNEPARPDAEGSTSATFSGWGWWAAFLTIPKSAVPGVSTTGYRADLLRTRRDRSYVWSPHLNAPWTDLPMARRGRIVFNTK